MASDKSMNGRIVIVDDDGEMRALLGDFLSKQGYEITPFKLATEALAALSPKGELARGTERGDLDLILSDIKMPEMDGLEFTSRIQGLRPEVPVILMTAFGSIETAIEAMKRGAYHYIVKPFKLAEIDVSVKRACEHRALQRENVVLRQELKQNWALGGVIGKSPGMRSVFDLVQRVSQATANVLITG
jgi:DNA-binding NtrC family response regulator